MLCFFFHLEIGSKNKIICEMLCFTIEMAVRLCEGRRCKMVVTDMVTYARLVSDRSAIGKCKCRWLNILERWLPGGAGLRMVALCCWRM